MTKVEIRYKKTSQLAYGVTLLKFDLSIDDAILKIIDLFDSEVEFILLKEEGEEDIIKIEKNGSSIEKSFMLNLFDLFSY